MLGNAIGLGSPSGVPEDFRPKFLPAEFGGATITTNPADYPDWDTVASVYSKTMKHFADGIAALSDEEIGGAAKGKVPKSLASMITCMQDSIDITLLHDSHHRGQFALIAKS